MNISKFTRARRKKAGLANVHYVRHGRFFVLLATHGQHVFFERERDLFHDARGIPIKYEGYAVGYRAGTSYVRPDRGTELNLKASFEDCATKRTAASIARQFRRLPFQPYAPVRGQLIETLDCVNRLRRAAGLERVPVTAVRWKRWIVKPFGEPPPGEDKAEPQATSPRVLKRVNSR